MMVKKIGIPNQASPVHDPKEEEIFGQVHQTEQINKKQEENHLNSAFQVEKVTKTKFILFTLYTISLLLIINLRISFSEQFVVNRAMRRFFLNQVASDDGTVTVINSTKPNFSGVQDAAGLVRYIRSGLIYSMFQDDSGSIVSSSNAFSQSQLICPLRVVQQRAAIIQQPGNVNFASRWNLHKSAENKTTYGNATYTFQYSPIHDGFPVILQILFWDYNTTVTAFNTAVNAGFFDTQTRQVGVDFAMYLIDTQYIIFFRMLFTFSPTGRVTPTVNIGSFRMTFYRGSKGLGMLAFQIIYVLLFLYYAAQEAIKVYNQVQNAATPDNFAPATTWYGKIILFLERLKKRIFTVARGMINHLKDPWSLLNIISLGCSLADIIIWVTLILQDTIQDRLDKMMATSDTDARQAILLNFNPDMEYAISLNILFIQVAAVNAVILIIKMLKFITPLNEKIMDQVQILVGVTNRILPFVILFVTILFSYVYMSYFLFGNRIQTFSSFFSALRYFFTNIHNNYSEVDDMIDADATTTLIFHVLFIFVVNFVLVNMFAIYVIHSFKDFINVKNAQQKKKEKIEGQYSFKSHPMWVIKNFFNGEFNLAVYRLFNKKRYGEQSKYLADKKFKEEKELIHYPTFNFDVSIEDTFKEEKKLNPIFNTDAAIRKVKKEQKVKTIKHIWSTLAVWFVFIISIVISEEHHQPQESANLTGSIGALLQQQDIKVLLPNRTVKTYGFARNLANLQTSSDILAWATQLFTQFLTPDNFTLKANEHYVGYFIAGDDFLVTDQIRMTIRKRSILPLESDVYSGINTNTISPLFSYYALNPPGELKSPLVGDTGTIYTYTPNAGFKEAGGYVLHFAVDEFEDRLLDVKDDGIIDTTINSVVIDFPVYHILAREIISVVIVFIMNEGSFIDTATLIDLIPMNFYQNAKQYFIAVAEIAAILWAVITSYKVYRALKTSNYHYNYWYSLYIANFPPVVNMQRGRKKPEFLRKLEYMFGFNTVINIILAIFIFTVAALWISYLTKISVAKNIISGFVQKTGVHTFDELTSYFNVVFNLLFNLKVLESIILILLSIKILYFYSYFTKFKFLTNTIKKSFQWMPQMFLIVFFVILAFGFFLQFVRGTNYINYSNVINMLAEQLQNMNQLEQKDESMLEGVYGVFVTVVYYFPWVIFAVCIVSNMFLGIILTAYQSIDEHISNEDEDEKITPTEFFKMTIELIKTRNKVSQQQRVHFEVNEQSMNSFNFERVFDDFGNLVDLAASYRNVDLWATACTQNILAERESRKTMRKISKEITKASVIDFDFEKHEHKRILTKNEKLSQFALKLKYWSYFKVGQEKLLQYMKIFNKDIKYNDKVLGDARNRRIQQKVDDKIKKYILHLEQQVSQNIHDVQQMRKKLEEYQKEKKE